MWVVGGPPGSGKSSLFPLERTGLDSFNVDDRCAALNGGSYKGIAPEIRAQAGRECEAFVDEHVREGTSFAVETTLRTTVTIDQAAHAKNNGFVTHLEYVATDDADESIRRVAIRAKKGGHAAAPSRIRETYAASMKNFVLALREFDQVEVYDNSVNARRPRLVLQAERGRVIFVATDPPKWVAKAVQAMGVS